MTFAPSSSTSRLTSRRRSGFAFNVCTPCVFSVDSMMYVGIAPPRRVSRRLVEVEQRGAEEEYGRDHEQRQKGRDRAFELTCAAEQEEEHRGREEGHDHQRRERSRRVDEVRPSQAVAPLQRLAEADPLDHRGRNRETEERQP